MLYAKGIDKAKPKELPDIRFGKPLILDSGTLITLSHLNPPMGRLDTLLATGTHIFVTDTVLGEVMTLDQPTDIFRDDVIYTPAYKGQDALYQFFRENQDRVHVVHTTSFERNHLPGKPGQYASHSGEESIGELIYQLGKVDPRFDLPGGVGVVHEDHGNYSTLSGHHNAVLMPTWTLLNALANLKRLPVEIGDLRKEIEGAGRHLFEAIDRNRHPAAYVEKANRAALSAASSFMGM